ncbi:MAG: leucyl/phenylalanyl-tRNA--protein transferase [Planctomycetota bacterium]|nr:MAG: leucyl/phenylalanyl-tRNA--protein transferase [Planctomycetota bacterium]
MTDHLEQDFVWKMIRAYSRGFFPMVASTTDAIDWFDPDPRGIIPLEPGAFRVSRSLRQRVRSGRFLITSDQAFEHVMVGCARPHLPHEQWIDQRMITAYSVLHAHGYAHSIEAWLCNQDGTRQLVGGLYGVAIGGLFAGESMFSLPGQGGTDAGKACLVHLVAHLRRRGFTLLDTQFNTPHLAQFGCVAISRSEYKRRLREAVERPCIWWPFTPGRRDADA